MQRVKRQYRSTRRQEQAQETRRLIAEAALELFTKLGFAKTSVRDVAERAGVSDQTIYKTVGDKIGLLLEAVVAYMESGGGGREAAFLDALEAEPDPLERFRIVARDSREQWESAALELDLMLFHSENRDPRLEELKRRVLAYRLESTRAACEVLYPDAIRHPGFSIDEIAEFATALDSAANVVTLQALGWSMDRWEQWVVKLLSLFLDPAHAAR